MKVKLTTAVLLIVCGLGIGWSAYQNIMWAVWGKQNNWYEYVGFLGCAIMFISGFVVLKSFKFGSYLGSLGYVLMLFYFAPALLNTFRSLAAGHPFAQRNGLIILVLIVVLPLLALARLLLNLFQINSAARS